MNATEVQECLIYLMDRAPQTKLEDGTAKAWGEDFARWDYDTAREAIRRATANKPFVGIAEITLQVRQVVQERVNAHRVAEQYSDAHCRRMGCGCDHSGCYRGWKDSTTHPGAVTPCPACRADLHHVLRNMPDLGDRGQGGYAPITDRNKTKEKA
jgi:hypothetical protein